MGANRLLQVLSDKPKSNIELMFELGLTSSAQLRKMVKELRKCGYPVCSSTRTGGYWLGDSTDVRRTINDLESRIRDMSDTVSRMKKMIPLDGQMKIDD